jgi:hypothetical protein
MERLSQIPPDYMDMDMDLSMFYHPDTEAEINALRNYLIGVKKLTGKMTLTAGSAWWLQTGSPVIPKASFPFIPSPPTRPFQRNAS